MKRTIICLFILIQSALSYSQNTQTLCSGSNATLSIGSAGLSNPTYTLLPGQIHLPNGIYIVNPTVNTSYTLIVQGTNSLQASETRTLEYNIIIAPQPLATVTVTQSTCQNNFNGFDINLTFTPTVSSYSISWSALPTGIFNNTQTAVYGNVAPGQYTATITAAGGCSTAASFTINPPPAQPVFQLSPAPPSYVINCYQPTVVVTSQQPSYNYTWTTSSNILNGPSVSLTSGHLGNWTVTATHPVSGCTSMQTFNVSQNTVTPTSTVTPLTQNITCSLSSITTVTAYVNPTVNVSHTFYSPVGANYIANTFTAMYLPVMSGTYTHCVMNNINGCSACKQFTVTSAQGFPTFSLMASPDFTLGCNSKSVTTISINNASTQNPPGGPLSYSIIGSTSSTQSSIYQINTPGTYTVVVRDMNTGCESRLPFSVISNTFAPNLSAVVPLQILDCNTQSVVLSAASSNTNVSYSWNYPGSVGLNVSPTMTIHVNALVPTSSLIANYTLSIVDNNSTCKSTSIIPMYQSLRPPTALITGAAPLTCQTPSVVLFNQSVSNVPTNIGFPTGQPVIGYLWFGPIPQPSFQNTTSYLAYTPGIYTLTVKDLNNGCFSTTTTIVFDNIVYALVNNPDTPGPFNLCGQNSVILSPIISSPTTNLTYTWSAPPGAIISGVNTRFLTTNTVGIYTLTVKNNPTGCLTTSTMEVVYCVGIDKVDPDNSFDIFPNPSSGIYKVTFKDLSAIKSMEVIDARGIIIQNISITEPNFKIDLTQQNSGIYFIRAYNKNGSTEIFKLMKQ